MNNTIQLIDWNNPVNWSHPLSRGLISCFLAVPGKYGFKTTVWRDLCKRHNGTLTNMDATSDWVTDGKKRWGHLDFLEASTQHVALPDVDYGIANGYTLSVWHYGNISAAEMLIGRDNTSATRFWQFGKETGPSHKANFIRFNSSGSVVTNITGTTQLINNVWRNVLVTFTGAGSAIYVNGKLEASDSVTTANQDGTGTAPAIGTRSASQNLNNLTGSIDSAFIWNRGFSAADAQAYYLESRNYYPGLLRREKPRKNVTVPAVGGGSATDCYYYYRMMQG